MPYRTQAERRFPYYTEAAEQIVLTPEEIERGQKFAYGLAQLRESFQGVYDDDYYLTCRGVSLYRIRLVVVPKFPILREIIRGDDFYEYTSPHERTRSKKQLVISDYEMLRPDDDEDPNLITIKGRSPGYTDGSDPFPLVEICWLDPTKHQLAIHKR